MNDEIFEILKPYLKQVNETPELLSILYDINLLPEVVVNPLDAVRMAAFCELFKRIPNDDV